MSQSHTITISVYGAGNNAYDKSLDIMKRAEQLGHAIAEQHCNLAIPAVAGFSSWTARATREQGGQVVGFSPAANEREHLEVYDLPTKHMDMIIYSGFGFAGSDLLLSRSSDAIIFGYGGLETAHEFWNAFQEGKPIGILKGGWSVDEILFALLRGYEGSFDHHRIVFDDDPKCLVENLITKAKQHRTKTYHLK